MFNVEEFVKKLSKPIHQPCHDTEMLLHQLKEAVHVPGDISFLIGPVVKLLPTHLINVKKTAYSVLPRLCAAHSEAALLALNTILQDCRDPNPVVRSLAVSTLCSLPTLLQEHAGAVLVLALNDSNPHVRHTAVVGCGTVFKVAPAVIHEYGFVNRLYESIRDSDPHVVTSSLLVLDMVLASEGGVVVNRSMAGHLLRHMGDFPDPQLATILQVLAKYQPRDEEELFCELTMLDPYLVHSSSAAVVVNCTQLFVSLTKEKHSQLLKEVIQRVVPVLKQFLSSTVSRDSTSHVLDFLLSIKDKDSDWLKAFEDSPHLFCPKEKSGHTKILHKKLLILPYVCTERNVAEVLRTLRERHCSNPSTSMEAIACIRSISSRLPSVAGSDCLRTLISLLATNQSQVLDNILIALQDFNLHRHEPQEVNLVVRSVIRRVDLSCPESVPPILPVLLGDFGELIDDQSPYVLEAMVDDFYSYKDEGMKHLILMAALKMFLKMPAKCQHILGEVFDKCLSSSSTGVSSELKEKALRYYRLLAYSVELARRMFLCTNP